LIKLYQIIGTGLILLYFGLMKALLIIDMQNISFTPKTPRFDSAEVIQRINRLSHKFRLAGDKVVFVQHDGTKEGFCVPNTVEWEILSSLDIEPDDLIISKIANDSFYNTTLKEELLKFGINELIITGCATDFCVDSTIKSALVNDFNVIVIEDAHTTADRPFLKAKQVIDHYNWMWSEMTPTKGKIKVVSIDKYPINNAL
jgi:nicotinamidase-related amidase